jgi:hypothetical protein
LISSGLKAKLAPMRSATGRRSPVIITMRRDPAAQGRQRPGPNFRPVPRPLRVTAPSTRAAAQIDDRIRRIRQRLQRVGDPWRPMSSAR